MTISLASYQDAIDLSPTRRRRAPVSADAALDAELSALAHLYAEHHEAEAPPLERLAALPPDRRAQMLHALLTMRPAGARYEGDDEDEPNPLPEEILEALDELLAATSDASVDLLTSVADVPSIADALFPSVAREELPPAYERISLWRGDITRLESQSLAIVNPANTGMLGCFQPSHRCADNVIHAASGPRLRADCYSALRSLRRTSLAVAEEALLTKGHSLPAGYVIHVAGPQLRRGASPTEDDIRLLRSAYQTSLDVAAEAGNIDAVAFPCISTGLFAFPANQAAGIALQAVSDWLESHRTSKMRAIFVLFSEADAAHYLAAIRTPSLPSPLPLVQSVLLPERVRQWVHDADSVIIHAGAGLSADAFNADVGHGLDYTSEALFSQLYPGFLKSTEMRTLYHSIGYNFKDRLVKWAFILAHGKRVLSWGLTPVYKSLLELAQAKSSYTVLTSNADNVFLQAGFDTERVWRPQGSYAHFQCLKPCSPNSYFPSQPWFDKAAPFIDPTVMRLPADRPDLIPDCPKCGGEVFLHVRGGNWFLETPQKGQAERYAAQVEDAVAAARAKGTHVVLLEFGAGFNTPSVVRWPSDELVEEHHGAVKLVRVNLARPEVPLALRENAQGVRMGAVQFLESVR